MHHFDQFVLNEGHCSKLSSSQVTLVKGMSATKSSWASLSTSLLLLLLSPRFLEGFGLVPVPGRAAAAGAVIIAVVSQPFPVS